MILHFSYLISPTCGWSWCYILLSAQSEDSSYCKSQAGSQPCLLVLREPSQLVPPFLRGISKDVPFSSTSPSPLFNQTTKMRRTISMHRLRNANLALKYLTKYSPNPFSLNKLYNTHLHVNVKAPSLVIPYANIKVWKS